MTNALRIIVPYWYDDTWVFDDPNVGLEREPFVSGIPDMINMLVREIPNARKGFRLIFSKGPFPGYQMEVSWVREEHGGHWYRLNDLSMEGWLCPALFRYFDSPPASIFVKAEPMKKKNNRSKTNKTSPLK
jgi:hypothetical protein